MLPSSQDISLPNTPIAIYTCPSDKYASISISLCNRSANPIDIRLALSVTGTVVDSEYLEYDFQLSPHNTMERTGLILAPNNVIVAQTSAAGISCVVYGLEK